MSQERLRVAETELQEGREALASMRERLVSLHDRDKAMEKNFKKAFPALNYNQLEALMKSFKYGKNSNILLLQFCPQKFCGGLRMYLSVVAVVTIAATESKMLQFLLFTSTVISFCP